MFERFTQRARKVVALAQEETRMLNHSCIGTEHILLGLLREGEGVAAQALTSLGISLEDARSQVETLIGKGQQAPTGHIPFTPRAKKVIELSLREALQLGHDYIGTEHLLLALIRGGESVGAKVLVELGAELSRVRQEVIQLLGGYQSPEAKHAEFIAGVQSAVRVPMDWDASSNMWSSVATPPEDADVIAIRHCTTALDSLPSESQARVLRYLVERFGV